MDRRWGNTCLMPIESAQSSHSQKQQPITRMDKISSSNDADTKQGDVPPTLATMIASLLAKTFSLDFGTAATAATMMTTAMIALAALLMVLVLMRLLAPEIYDVVIVNMTSRWYQVVLERIDEGYRVLDVGIGTATALCRNGKIIKSKKLVVEGIDIDTAYVEKSQKVISNAGLSDRVRVVERSVYDKDLKTLYRTEQRPFDAVYFSGSITLMPDPVEALRAVTQLLRKDGKGLIYITQTYQKVHTPLLGTIKPALKYFTTIDFGQLTYLADIQKILGEFGAEIVLMEQIPGSVNTRFQSAYLIVLKPYQKPL